MKWFDNSVLEITSQNEPTVLAKLLRDSDDVNDQHLPDVSDDLGGYAGDQ